MRGASSYDVSSARLSGCRQQDMRRVGTLAFLAAGGGVAGPVLDPDGQLHLVYGRAQVAFYVGGKRLERRDVKRMQPVVVSIGQFDQSRQKPRQRLAASGGGDQQKRRIIGAGQHRLLMRMHEPATAGEPFRKNRGQGRHTSSLVGVIRKGNPMGNIGLKRTLGCAELSRAMARPRDGDTTSVVRALSPPNP